MPLSKQQLSNLGSIETLRAIMKALRDPISGCPWDVKQDHKSIAAYTIEEAYEVVDAIELEDMDELRDELGDLLLQVIFHSEMADERHEFALHDVIEAICTKMIRRHPHVFGNETQRRAKPEKGFWEDIKATEKTLNTKGSRNAIFHSALDNVPKALPAITRAEKLQKKAARVGFDWPTVDGVFDKVTEELAEIRQAITDKESDERIGEEIGDLLFSVVNLSRHLSHNPETMLRNANNKFQQRFTHMEKSTHQPLTTLNTDELEELWANAKKTR